MFTFSIDFNDRPESALRWITARLTEVISQTDYICQLRTIVAEVSLNFTSRYEWEQTMASVLDAWGYFIEVVRGLSFIETLNIKLCLADYDAGRWSPEEARMRLAALADYLQAYLCCIGVHGRSPRVVLYTGL